MGKEKKINREKKTIEIATTATNNETNDGVKL